jgi:hypothetical protein
MAGDWNLKIPFKPELNTLWNVRLNHLFDYCETYENFPLSFTCVLYKFIFIGTTLRFFRLTYTDK